VTIRTQDEQHVFEAEVHLNHLDSKTVRVELYAEGIGGGAPVRQEMAPVRRLAGGSGDYLYRAAVPATRPVTDYTARVIPHYDGVAVPQEAPQILWQR
jgi:starch phosphorylase